MSERFQIFVDLQDRASGLLRRIGTAGTTMGRRLRNGARMAYRGMTGLLRRLTSLRAILAGGAFVAATRNAIKLWGEQLAVNRQLAIAIRRHGESAKELLPVYKEFADLIQRTTTVENEAVQQTMALGLNMGIATGQIEAATKAAIGLSKGLDMNLTTAMRLVARANSGNTDTLSRYGITIDNTLSSQERFNELLRQGASMFALATDEVEDVDGAMAQAGNSFRDLQKRLGEIVDRVFDLRGAFRQLRDWLDNVGLETFERHLERIRERIITLKNAFREIFEGGDRSDQAMEGLRLVITGSFASAAHKAAEILMKYAPRIGELIGNTVKAFIPTSQNQMMRRAGIEEFSRWDEWRNVAQREGIDESEVRGRWQRWSSEAKRVWLQHFGGFGDDIMGDDPGAMMIARGKKLLEPFAPPPREERPDRDYDSLDVPTIGAAVDDGEAAEYARRAAEARESMRRARWSYEFERAEDSQQLEMLRRLERGLLARGRATEDPTDRADLYEEWLSARSRRERLEERMADARDELAPERTAREMTEIGIRDFFRHMRGRTEGRDPAEVTAENTREMRRLLQKIAEAEGVK